MVDVITTKSIASGIADVNNDFILQEKPHSRLVFQAQIHEKGIKGRIIRQRRESKEDEWIPEKALNIRDLGKNESINIELSTEAVGKFYTAIHQLIHLLFERGIEYGEKKYAVIDPNDLIVTEDNKVTIIKKMLSSGLGEEIWDTLSEDNPSLATKLAYSKIYSDRKKALIEFEESLTKTKNENYWQKFFADNTWIFGYGLRYHFLNVITEQPIYSGANFDRSGDQRGDYLLNTEARKKFTVLVEIKKPQTEIVLKDGYRAGTWKLGNELLWAVSQMQSNCTSWFKDGSTKDDAKDNLESKSIYTYQPKGILLIGNTEQLDNRDKRQTFEAFRRNLMNPEIVTFDELFERAKFIVEHGESVENNEKQVDFSQYDFVPDDVEDS
jgi:hypothetical protein